MSKRGCRDENSEANVGDGSGVGCTYRPPRTEPAATVPIVVPSASPTTIVVPPARTATRVAYPDGAYELRGDGRTMPYYWMWVPAGAQAPMLPPPPTR